MIPQNIVQKLQEIEPTASFSGLLPQVISSSGVSYFVKVGSPLEQGQYAGEAESLKAIEDAAHWAGPSHCQIFLSAIRPSRKTSVQKKNPNATVDGRLRVRKAGNIEEADQNWIFLVQKNKISQFSERKKGIGAPLILTFTRNSTPKSSNHLHDRSTYSGLE